MKESTQKFQAPAGLASNHTPGPWEIEDRKDGGRTVVDSAGRSITFTPQFEGAAARSIEEAIANARLIAAAPDLLDAIVEMIMLADEGAFIDLADVEATPVSRKLRAAIAKAQAVSRE